MQQRPRGRIPKADSLLSSPDVSRIRLQSERPMFSHEAVIFVGDDEVQLSVGSGRLSEKADPPPAKGARGMTHHRGRVAAGLKEAAAKVRNAGPSTPVTSRFPPLGMTRIKGVRGAPVRQTQGRLKLCPRKNSRSFDSLRMTTKNGGYVFATRSGSRGRAEARARAAPA